MCGVLSIFITGKLYDKDDTAATKQRKEFDKIKESLISALSIKLNVIIERIQTKPEFVAIDYNKEKKTTEKPTQTDKDVTSSSVAEPVATTNAEPAVTSSSFSGTDDYVSLVKLFRSTYTELASWVDFSSKDIKKVRKFGSWFCFVFPSVDVLLPSVSHIVLVIDGMCMRRCKSIRVLSYFMNY